MTEAERLRPLLAEGAEPHVLEGLISMAEQHGPRGCRMVRPALLARYGFDDVLQAEQDAAKRFVALTQPHDDGTGVFEYRLALDVEGKAVLEAALGPLSAPRPVDGERDLTAHDQRRGEALVELVRRAVAAGESVPTSPRRSSSSPWTGSQLAGGLRGAGTTVGGSDTGTLLAPETVRRLACDASIIPMVLGAAGEVLDLGRSVGSSRRPRPDDCGCATAAAPIPGCGAPHGQTASPVHWADFGPTDLGNAALLCERHHTVVHNRRLAGRVVEDRHGTRVEWDLARGSYDQLLARRAAQEPA